MKNIRNGKTAKKWCACSAVMIFSKLCCGKIGETFAWSVSVNGPRTKSNHCVRCATVVGGAMYTVRCDCVTTMSMTLARWTLLFVWYRFDDRWLILWRFWFWNWFYENSLFNFFHRINHVLLPTWWIRTEFNLKIKRCKWNGVQLIAQCECSANEMWTKWVNVSNYF